MKDANYSKLMEISEKVSGAKDISEAREILTDEELIFYFIAKNGELSETIEGEECIIKNILKLLGTKEYSVKHSLHLLDTAKEVLISIARFKF